MMENQMKIRNTIRWSARIIGTLILALVLFFLLADIFGSANSSVQKLSTKDGITFVFFPLSTIIGLALAWKWEAMGEFITILGLVGLLIMRPDLASNSLLMAIVACPGLLYLISWYISRQHLSDLG